MRATSTLVAVVGTDLEGVLDRVDRSANVSVEPVGELPEPILERIPHLRDVWRRATRHGGSVFTLVGADPIAPLVEAWGRRLEGGRDDLELAIGLTRQPVVPDYYLVDAAIGEPAVHWYADHLRTASPNRVVLLDPTPPAILRALSGLRYGPAFPPGDELVASAREYVPLPEPTPGEVTPSPPPGV